MAEKVVSPGVFTNEIDASFLPAAVAEIGACVIGPTVKGPALVPTVVTSYSEYVQMFGDTFKSGSGAGGGVQQYLTSLTAEQYLKHADKLTVVRILDGAFSGASSNVPTGSTWSNATADPANIAASGATGSAHTASMNWSGANVGPSFVLNTISDGDIMNNAHPENGGNPDTSGSAGTSGDGTRLTSNGLIVESGSEHNIRWQVTDTNVDNGTFNLLIRQGSDTNKRKQILETWSNLSLDPNSNNYIAKRIGDSYHTIAGTVDEPYLTFTGQYPNNSAYVYVSGIIDTPDYLDENGNVRTPAASASLPGINSGSFVGGDNGTAGFDALGNLEGGTVTAANYIFNENIAAASQGYAMSTGTDGTEAYKKALNLIKNQDEYDINMILLPGLEQEDHSTIISKAIDVAEDRGDCFVIADPVRYGRSVKETTAKANEYDSNYAAMYWPWVQIPDNQLGKNVWVPPSVVMGGIYAFNDKVAHPWFAPAGLNRGGINTAIQAERKLTQGNRDTLYNKNVNPIATFPGQGVTVWGQKTLQKKPSALDRINVRRLLIKCKKFIASSSRFLVFEQNTAATRRRFLNIVNPFLEQVQANSGLNAFRVVMDETNNTPDVVDRNILYGQIFVQPTKTAEFIVLDFTVQPTGATFPE